MSSVTSKALRTSLRRTASCSRYSSSQASSATSSSRPPKLNVQPKSTLPADKMRTLVELYHQSQNFITIDNLSDQIDDAFIRRPSMASFSTQLNAETPYGGLAADLANRRAMPKFGRDSDVVPKRRSHQTERGRANAQNWSDFMNPRDKLVRDTLYGVVDKGLPGYDALQDAYAEVKEELEEEKAQRGQGA
ncbi:hypothetical protein C8Q76DRAFT_722499 [Earliella scabrosa]|nr:hypothetical protein C8Q76DRAFT_722499 [Earliella scabrosa]